jgi:HD-GYP domain-containing protein (c-di-GMP phosphodiesterase class II)
LEDPDLVLKEASDRLTPHVRKGEKASPQAVWSASLEGSTLTDHETVDQVLRRAVNSIEAILQAVRTRTPFPLSLAAKAVEGLLRGLKDSDALLIPFFSREGPSPGPAREAVHVAIISLKIGLDLRYASEALHRLGLVALLHDVGMARLPEVLLTRKGALHPEVRAAMQRHSEEGARLLMGLGSQAGWLAEGVIQVHERMDGSGYPKGLTRQEIHDDAYIVGLADVYESLVHPRPFRRCLGALEALKEILTRERTTFPERILKALIRTLSAFPVGSLVRLNTGEIGRVVAKHPNLPLRPIVEVLIHQEKRLEEPLVIDLKQSPLLYIQESLIEEALP